MNINEKAAYIKGLYDGLELQGTSKEAKIIGEMLDLVSKMADAVIEANQGTAEDVEVAVEEAVEA